ncbi:hypothetical protein V497_03360 [Pseudogymnoascus sp. VKM F-4516 (FW-969)]|nr:hypothetical protein V497_03360 [Pseudogymnoascus sp. VKM F-4516 (FW-969)]
MGTFVFKWEHPASEVIVTGTFDNWAQTEKLHKKGDIFEKEVTLPSAADKIYYKFLVDGNWVTDHTAPQENDNLGNLNNYLTTDRIKKHAHTPASAAIMSGVTPNSTTAALAKDVPKENGTSSALPGAFPETPATEPDSFSVNPIPASEGAGNPVTLAPGEAVPAPSTINSNTITSGVHDDEELKAADYLKQTYGVNPIPATAGPGNPITLAPGEPVPSPSTITGNTIASTVRTDKESYENSGGLGTAPVLPPVVTPEAERASNGTGVLDLPSTKGGLIPESSLGMGEGGSGNYDANPTIQSVGPGATTAALAGAVPLEKNHRGNKNATISSVGPTSTTAALAGAVPLEKKSSVPEVVKESQEAANFPPEASAVPEEVEEKKEVEKELLSGVPLAPVTSDDTHKEAAGRQSSGAAEAAAAVGAAAVAVGGAAVAFSSAAKDKVTEAVSGSSASGAAKSIPLPESIRQSITDINDTAKRQSVAGIQATNEVPEPVRESISKAHESPEAAAYQVPVLEKKEVEGELLREVPTDVSKGESAPSADKSVSGAGAGAGVAGGAVVAAAPAVIAQSKEEKVAKEAVLPKESVVSDISDVSPGTVPPPAAEKQTSPAVTTGVASGVVPATSTGTATTAAAAPATPAKDTTASTAAAKASAASPAAKTESPSSAAATKEAQQKKRRSFFGKLKDKLKDL